MTKTAKTQNTDPLAAVRTALIDGVDTVVANNAKVVDLAQAELAKAKELATENTKKAQTNVHANVDAAVAAGEIVAAGAEEVATLLQDEVSKIIDGRVTALKQIFGATTPKDVFDIQLALVKDEQARAKSFVDAAAELVQGVADNAVKPVQVQFAENVKALTTKVA